MNRCCHNGFAILILSFFIMTALFHTGCASSEHTRLRDRVHSMSDMELLNYYYGINDRLKDIDGELQADDRVDSDYQDQFIQNQTFFVGGQGHGLLQKRKIVWGELQRRNITP